MIILERSGSEIGIRNSTPVSSKASGSPKNAVPEYRKPPVGSGAMPSASENPVGVCPDRGLRERALKDGWQVLEPEG